MATTRKQTEIQSAAIARGTDKVTHETFYVVQSDTDPNTWYQVRWNNQALMWCCNCPARCDGCKHQRATLEVLKIRRARIALAMGGEVPAIVNRMQAEEDRKYNRPTSEMGNLNGGGRAFWSVIPDSPHGRRDRCLFYCYLILGRRRAELLRLTWGAIQPALIDGRPSHTYSYVGKGSSRTVRQKELPAECYQMICELLREEGRLETIQGGDYIFASSHRPGQPLCGDFVGQKFHKYCLAAGLPVERISLHSLRWSSAYHRAMGGSSITDVRDLLDHQSLAITSRYLSGMISTHDSGADKLTRQFSFLR